MCWIVTIPSNLSEVLRLDFSKLSGTNTVSGRFQQFDSVAEVRNLD